jgi:hypothetical protein
VNHSLEGSCRIRLIRKGTRLLDAGQIAHECCSGTRNGLDRMLRSIIASPMKDDIVAEPDQPPRGQLAKAIGGTGNENACH